MLPNPRTCARTGGRCAGGGAGPRAGGGGGGGGVGSGGGIVPVALASGTTPLLKVWAALFTEIVNNK